MNRIGRTPAMERAFAAGAALVAGTVVVTGIFVAKIASSFAADQRAANTPASSDGTTGQDNAQTFGGQLFAPQNQPPQGGSNGS
jgi:hypothetical protein